MAETGKTSRAVRKPAGLLNKASAKGKKPPSPARKEKKQTPSAGGKKKQPAKKTQKVSPDIWYAVLLTSSLILVSIIIALVTITISTGKETDVTAEAAGELPASPPEQPPQPVPAAAAVEKPAPVIAVPAKPAAVQNPPTMPGSVTVTDSVTTPAKPAAAPQKPVTAPPVVTAAPAFPAPVIAAPAQPPAVQTPSVPQQPAPAAAVMARPAPPQPPPKQRGTVAFIIDDAGSNLHELEPFLNFPGPITIAVLPGLPYSAEAARRIRAAGKEVFLHQPMEAMGGQPPGPGAIYSGMTAAEVQEVLNRNIAEIGPVAGMNNHQGSKITADRQIMETVLAFCRDQGIRFLDSRTTAETAVPAAARSLGMKIGERNIFIDNEQERAAMSRAINGGLALAAGKGSAVMIGHVWSPELAVLLTELHQNLVDQGYSFSSASDLIDK